MSARFCRAIFNALDAFSRITIAIAFAVVVAVKTTTLAEGSEGLDMSCRPLVGWNVNVDEAVVHGGGASKKESHKNGTITAL